MKKAFTLIELLIVITLLGLLFMGFRQAFSSGNKEFTRTQVCYNNTYADIRNYIDGAITSKSLFSRTENKYVKPDKYIIEFDKPNSIISYKYKIGTDTYSYKISTLRKDSSMDEFCYSKTYHTDIGGDTNIKSISINAGLNGSINEPAITIIGSNDETKFTGNILFRYCGNGDPLVCKDIGRVIMDKRIIKITPDRCLLWNKTQTDGNQICNKRSIGE